MDGRPSVTIPGQAPRPLIGGRSVGSAELEPLPCDLRRAILLANARLHIGRELGREIVRDDRIGSRDFDRGLCRRQFPWFSANADKNVAVVRLGFARGNHLREKGLSGRSQPTAAPAIPESLSLGES